LKASRHDENAKRSSLLDRLDITAAMADDIFNRAEREVEEADID
jgi:hypothetical protein